MVRKRLISVVLVIGLALAMHTNVAGAESSIVRAVSNFGEGLWGLLLRTPEAVVVDVCAGAANLISGVTLLLSDAISIGDKAPAGKYVFDGVFSDGLEEFACFAHVGASHAIEIGTRRDFYDIPIDRQEFLQKEDIFHKEAYKTFSYSVKSFGLAVMDLATGIPANLCKMAQLTDTADSITRAWDEAAENMFGTVEWKYERD